MFLFRDPSFYFHERWRKCRGSPYTHRIHEIIVILFNYIYDKHQPNVGRYTIQYALICFFRVGLSRFASIICHSPNAQMNYMFVVSDLKSNSTYEDIRTKTTEKRVKLGWNSSYFVCVYQKGPGTFPLLWLLYILGSFLSPGVCLCEYHFGMCKPTTRGSTDRCQVPWWILGSPISLRSISKLPWMRCTPAAEERCINL